MGAAGGWLRSLAVADTAVTQLPEDLVLTALGKDGPGQSRPVMEWLTTFHLASVVLDPYTNESSWILRTATRILDELRGADVRINFVVTAPPEDARAFLGPLTERFLVFCDPDRQVVKALGLDTLPAFAFIRVDGAVAGVAEGWDPAAWERITQDIAKITRWIAPTLPEPGDPGPFRGSPALG